MRLFRISNLLYVCCTIFFACLLFWTSQSVQQSEDEVARLSQDIGHEKDRTHVLEAEWYYLVRPQRLEILARTILGMDEASSEDMIDNAAHIPEPSMPALPRAKPASFEQKAGER